MRVVENEHDAMTRIGPGEDCADLRFEVVVLEHVLCQPHELAVIVL